MSIRATIDEANWLELPTDERADAAEWLGSTLDRIRENWPGGLDVETEAAVREELQAGLDSVRPEDSLTLQYWPWVRPVTGVVHLVLSEFAEGDERPAYLLGDGGLSADPVFEVVDAAHLGQGVEVRMLTRPDGVPGDLAGLTQLYVSGERFVGVGVDATLPGLLAILLPDLRALLDTVEVVDDDDQDPWIRSEVDPLTLPEPGEFWPARPRVDARA